MSKECLFTESDWSRQAEHLGVCVLKEGNSLAVEAMRKSLSPALSTCDSLSTARVFGVPLEELQQDGQPGQEVPVLVKRIVEYIEEHGGLDLEGLFLVNGNAERVEWLRQRYESGEEVDLEKEADLASAVSLLRLFLQELPEPIIPAALQAHILQLYQDFSTEEEQSRNMKYFLQQLPQANYSLLRFLCRFLCSVASLQEESWSAGALAAVFGPDVFHIDTEVEDLKEQESVGRILADLLENQEDLFDCEEEDFSTTNDYSSVTGQITELLDDEKLEQCEDLPQDSEDSPEESQNEDSASSSSHITPISILPASADIIERTIRAAVEQHLFDLQSSIEQEIHSYERQGAKETRSYERQGAEETRSYERQGAEETRSYERQGAEETRSYERQGAEETRSYERQGAEGLGQGEAGTGPAERDGDSSQPGLVETQPKDCPEEMGDEEEEESRQEVESAALLEGSGSDADTEALVETENNINTARQEDCRVSENDNEAELITCPGGGGYDENANSESTDRPGQPGPTPHLDLHRVFQGLEAPCPITFPLIDFKSMHLQKDGEDPVPAFKSWQEDCESGEAQLSPLAGRMVHHPLEEDSHVLLARRFLDFGHSQRFLQTPDASSSSPPTKALSFRRPRRASFSSRETGKGDAVPVQFTKKLQNLKKKIKQFEEQFEKERNYKPSHSDKAANAKVLKWMTELTKLRKQIKDTKRKSSDGEFPPQPRPRSNTLPKSFGSTLDHGESEGTVQGRPSPESTVDLILRRLRDKREEASWPEDMKKMTKENLLCEKTALQKNLLYYESIHGRPVTREERQIVKPLYERYRLVKQMLTRASITTLIGSPSSKRRGQMLQPIIEGVTAHFCDEINEEDEEDEEDEAEEEEEEEEEGGVSEDTAVTIMLDPASLPHSFQAHLDREKMDPKLEESSGRLARNLCMSNTNTTSMPELLEQLWKARADKKQLRKSLRDFEDDFYQQNGRNVQKEDRSPMGEEYKEYKRIKAKLRLLEVLISKQDSSKSI
ncbi:protein FAM13B-like isoform X2 [Acipenser ruthenus]|uniref:protein FAM13B-like isoform X2 n=1 Tax=Acipenser ruthenus TaxID=7906 RepID=UPI002740D05B|nr:protein FAM13B-like isoform X2 [Acipenser ruthenus]